MGYLQWCWQERAITHLKYQWENTNLGLRTGCCHLCANTKAILVAKEACKITRESDEETENRLQKQTAKIEHAEMNWGAVEPEASARTVYILKPKYWCWPSNNEFVPQTFSCEKGFHIGDVRSKLAYQKVLRLMFSESRVWLRTIITFSAEIGIALGQKKCSYLIEEQSKSMLETQNSCINGFAISPVPRKVC